ncbi:hypothetical protein ABPG73_008224 [Tetrahymena malaccensis]
MQIVKIFIFISLILTLAQSQTQLYQDGLESLKLNNLQSKNNHLFANKYLHKLLQSSIIDEAILDLCPFPGYHGNYCPQQIPSFLNYQRQLQQDILKMPQGIGASFDISTGQLKLPAIQLTYSDKGQIYKDPLSESQFIIADETLVEQVNLDADVKIFQNEFELTNIWLNATKNGQWLGGEYSQSKDLNDVFQKFFKGNQETSISQLLKNTVRLTFKDNNLKLNKFAQRAIDALPQAYQADIYNEFIDSWGTHISVDTFIGGMIEKQTVFKDCVYASKSFTGGLSADQVAQALRNELHGEPAEGYFVARRQVSLDHKFGGNPENVQNWESTISQNPALLKINSFISWDKMASDPQIKANLQQAINNRIETMKQRQESYQAEVKEQRRLQSNTARQAFAVSGLGLVPGESTSQIYQIRNQFTLKETSQCPVDLPIETSKSRCSSGDMSTILGFLQEVRYERDENGNFRAIMQNLSPEETHLPPQFYGNFVDRGCSIVQSPLTPQYTDLNQIPPNDSVFKMICTDCVPTIYNAPQGKQLQCLCPGF